MRALVAMLCFMLVACGAGARLERRGADADGPPQQWHYVVRADEGLSRLDVTVCFEGQSASELRAGKDEAASHLRHARWLSPGPARRLMVVDGRIQLDRSQRDACLEYRVALEQRPGMGAIVRQLGNDVVASPNVWLWRPEHRAVNARATLRLELPDRMRALLPWPLVDGRYELDAQAFAFDSYAAFGELDLLRFEHRGVPVEAAVLDGPLRLDAAGVQRWLRDAIDIVSLSGRFPAQRLRVLIAPSPADGDPVQFGMVARGGSGSVLLFMSERATEQELRSDWVLPHELSHLWLPYVGRAHAWLSEGLATYLQELLRAQAGALPAEDVLLGMAAAVRSARRQGTGRSMREESRAMHQTHAYRPVYWSGAAYFLMADVELRRRTNSRVSLNSVLLALHARGDYGRTWELEPLLARLDELAGEPVFAPLARQCLPQPFPDVEPTLLGLGLTEEAPSELLAEAPLAELRSVMFGPQPHSP